MQHLYLQVCAFTCYVTLTGELKAISFSALMPCPTDLKPNGLSSKLDKTRHCSFNPKCNTWKFMTRLKAARGPIHKNVEDEEEEQEEKLHVLYYKPRCNSCLEDDNG